MALMVTVIFIAAGPVVAKERKPAPRKDRAAEASEDGASRSRRARADSRRDDDEYAARAADSDPSGTYKAFPNWARAALGTKPYSR